MDLLELKCTSISTVSYNSLREVLLKYYIKLYACNTVSSDGRFKVSSIVFKHF